MILYGAQDVERGHLVGRIDINCNNLRDGAEEIYSAQISCCVLAKPVICRAFCVRV
jgi:hypothetical protein